MTYTSGWLIFAGLLVNNRDFGEEPAQAKVVKTVSYKLSGGHLYEESIQTNTAIGLGSFAVLGGGVTALAFADVAIEKGAASVTQAAYGVSAGGVVYYGSYPQSAYTPTSAPSTPATGTTYTDTDGTQFVYSPKSSLPDYYKIEPVAWRVLSNAGDKLFLLADKNLDANIPYNDVRTNITWENSTIRTWLNGAFYAQTFSAEEQQAVATTTVVNGSASNPDYSTPGGNNTQDQVFFLSVAEARNSSYGFVDNASRLALNTAYAASKPSTDAAGVADDWWLRSPGSVAYGAALVSAAGVVNAFGDVVERDVITVRPAFNLNLSSVIFTSAASGTYAKSAASVGSGFMDATSLSGSVKFTVQDASQDLDVLATTAQSTQSVPVTGSLSFGYANATTGTNQYVSAVLVNSGGVAYYTKLADNSSTSSDTLSIPLNGVAPDTYTLKLFSEQANGDNYTDFASTPITMTLTVTGGTATVSDFVAGGGTIDDAPLLSAPSASRTSDSAATVTFSSDEAGTFYWQLDGAAPTAASLVVAGTNATTLAAAGNTVPLTSLATGAHTLYVAADDGAGNISNLLAITIPAMPVVPGAPTGVTAVAGDAQATVGFTPPASDGGSPITTYIVTATSVGGGTPISSTFTTNTVTFLGLTNGVTYTFTVVATNAVGLGAPSAASNPVTPKYATPFTVTKHFGTYSGTGTTNATVNHDDTLFTHLVANATGATVAASNYTVTAGSTIITLSEAYAKTFPVGYHHFTAVYSDGSSAPITLQVLAAGGSGNGGNGGGSGSGTGSGDPDDSGSDIPTTGDSSLPPALLASFFGLAGVWLLSRSARRKSYVGVHRR